MYLDWICDFMYVPDDVITRGCLSFRVLLYLHLCFLAPSLTNVEVAYSLKRGLEEHGY